MAELSRAYGRSEVDVRLTALSMVLKAQEKERTRHSKERTSLIYNLFQSDDETSEPATNTEDSIDHGANQRLQEELGRKDEEISGLANRIARLERQLNIMSRRNRPDEDEDDTDDDDGPDQKRYRRDEGGYGGYESYRGYGGQRPERSEYY